MNWVKFLIGFLYLPIGLAIVFGALWVGVSVPYGTHIIAGAALLFISVVIGVHHGEKK